jgi:hypothetical protein
VVDHEDVLEVGEERQQVALLVHNAAVSAR